MTEDEEMRQALIREGSFRIVERRLRSALRELRRLGALGFPGENMDGVVGTAEEHIAAAGRLLLAVRRDIQRTQA